MPGMILFIFFLCSNIATEDMLYTESDIENSMDKIETINFHQVQSLKTLWRICN